MSAPNYCFFNEHFPRKKKEGVERYKEGADDEEGGGAELRLKEAKDKEKAVKKMQEEIKRKTKEEIERKMKEEAVRKLKEEIERKKREAKEKERLRSQQQQAVKIGFSLR